MQHDRLEPPLERNRLLGDEPKPFIVRHVALGAALEVRRAALAVGPRRHVRDELLGVASAARAGPGAQVDEVVRVVVAGAQDVVLGVVEQREELGVEAGFAFGGELVPEAPEPGSEDGPEVVYVFARWHPGFVSFWPRGSCWGEGERKWFTRELRRRSLAQWSSRCLCNSVLLLCSA